MSQELRIVDGSVAGSWITLELSQDLGRVDAHVPSRYSHYLRVLHPAIRSDGRLASWREVAAEKGRQVHPLVQWHTLVGARNPERIGPVHWKGLSPSVGTLPFNLLHSLCLFLEQATADSSECFVGVWEGWSTGLSIALPKELSGDTRLSNLIEESEGKAKQLADSEMERLSLVGRRYIVLQGPLTALTQRSQFSDTYSPNLIWPASRKWFVATEVDFDSTLIGTDQSMAESILSSDQFEAWEISPKDSLTLNSDRINRQR